MSEEPKYTIGRGTQELGAFTPAELIRDYNSLVKCEGVWVVINSQPQPLWNAVSKWHRAQSAAAIREPKGE